MQSKKSRPPRVLLYGSEGIGKSTFGEGCPNPIFIPTEDGLDEIDAAKFPKCNSFQEVSDNLDILIADRHDFGSVVLDTADWTEKLIHKEVCRRDSKASIELCAGGFGKGYGVALELWHELLDKFDRLRDRGMVIVILAHANVSRFEDPDQSVSYDRYTLKLNDSKKFSSSALICEWCDAVLFATRKVLVKTESKKVGNETKIRGVAVTLGGDEASRIIRPYGSPSAIAKNRYGIKTEIPLSWRAFVDAIASSATAGKQS
jgi:hypothetical protein